MFGDALNFGVQTGVVLGVMEAVKRASWHGWEEGGFLTIPRLFSSIGVQKLCTESYESAGDGGKEGEDFWRGGLTGGGGQMTIPILAGGTKGTAGATFLGAT